MTGNQLAYAIAAKSSQKDAAALFLNWLTTPEAAAVASKNGYPSAIADSNSKTLTMSMSATDQIQAGYSAIAKGNGFSSWLQNATKDMTVAETAQLQNLFAGKTTADAVVTTLQSTFAKSANA
ncbi:hypothetical protein [Branchiibius cervicis]|uniref:Extracellular solute-binding protein n=1 Tax=Branchiibius cervicis TaxID=908252 RepID=A0ABW2ARX2_9MICO